MAAVTFIVFLSVYLLTLVREVDWGDSAELSLAAWKLGVTHPPGSPVHTLIGKLFTLPFHEPALGTNLLSAFSASGAAALVSATVMRLTRRRSAALLAGLIFALLPPVWSVAVVTEVYALNALLVALALFCLRPWSAEPQSGRRALAAGLLFGLCLGTYLADFLLFPGFLLLAAWPREGRAKDGAFRRAVLYTAGAALLGSAAMAWTVLRSRAAVPIGTEFVPDSPRDLLLYLSGSQYETMKLHDPLFYLRRVASQGAIFAANFMVLGILPGLVGFWWLRRRRRLVALAGLVAAGLDLLYFTGYEAQDYYLMVTPAYLIFSIWLGCGIHSLLDGTIPGRAPRAAATLSPGWTRLVYAASALIAASLLLVQLGDLYNRSRATPVTGFVRESFRIFPPDAVVIAHWSRFTPLLYFQQVHGTRPDLTLVELWDRPRRYALGTVAGWRSYARAALRSRDVIVDGEVEGLEPPYALAPLGPDWKRIVRLPERPDVPEHR